MTPELTVLALAILWQGVQFALVAIPANLELNMGLTLGPRDSGPLEQKVSLRVARLSRALDNHFAALTLFTAAVLVVSLSETGNAWTAALAWAYLAARVAYVPAYFFGWQPWRSLLWLVAFFATMMLPLTAFI